MEAVSSKAVKAGFWYTVSNFLLRGIAFITTPVFTRIMTKEDYGYYNNFSSWLSLLAVLTTLELYSSINRAKFDYEENLDSYISSILLCGSLFTGICYIVVIVFQNFFTSLFGMEMIYIHVMFTYLLVSPAIQLLATKNRQLLRYRNVVILSVASSFCATLFSVLLVLLLADKVYGRIFGGTMPLIIFNLAIYIYILSKGRRLDWNYCKYGVAIAVPLLPHLLAGNILGTTDRIIISKYCGSEYTALYSVIYSCATLFSIIQQSVNQAWTPWFYEQLHHRKFARIKKVSKIYILLFCAIVIAIMLISPEIILLVAGKGYMGSVYLMPPIILGCIYLFLYTLYVNVEIYNKKTFGISINTILAAAINLVLNILLIPAWGYMAAAYTTLIGYLALLCAHFYASRKLDIREFYDNRFIFSAAAIMFVISMLILPLYLFPAVRLIVTVLYVMVLCRLAWGYRDEIRKMKLFHKRPD